MWRRRPAPPPYPDPEQVAKLCRELVSMLPTRKYVLIEHVLTGLDPGHRVVTSRPAPDPRADPLTGCLPVCAPEAPR
jgi:hypothetical protein